MIRKGWNIMDKDTQKVAATAQCGYYGAMASPTTAHPPSGEATSQPIYPPTFTMPSASTEVIEKKSLVVAYLLCLTLGLFGAHHFYLRRYIFGFYYACTAGMMGVGWLIDFFRMPCLVSDANKMIEEYNASNLQARPPQFNIHNAVRRPRFSIVRKLDDAYIMWFPFGLWGFHHMYLGSPLFAMYYAITIGGCGIGFLIDLFRMPFLVKRANRKFEALMNPSSSTQRRDVWTCYLDDAYVLLFPFGFLGLHHFYLRRYKWGVLYLCTVGLLGIGWLIDFVRLPWLVKEANEAPPPPTATRAFLIAPTPQRECYPTQGPVSQRILSRKVDLILADFTFR